MKQSRATVRYAKSFIDISNEQGSLDTSYNDMMLISSICSTNKDFTNLLKSPIIKTDLKVKIINELFVGSISPLTISFITLITNKKREGLLPEISNSFIYLYKKNKNIKEVLVTTAVPLDAELRNDLMNYIKKATNSDIELKENVDDSLIGGAIIRMDDTQLDASISSSLKSLKQKFSKNLYIENY
tara:strand:- start:34 stop:591 length:558 start_codon:yes stop_codon:yes gene_type:complete